MSQEPGISWGKIMAICSAFGIPGASLAFWLIVSGTQLVDTVHTIAKNQEADHKQLEILNQNMAHVNHILGKMDTSGISIYTQPQQKHRDRDRNNIQWQGEKRINGKTYLVPYTE